MFLGEIGGNMGLFLGCSLLTIFEFIDVIIRIATRRGRQVLHMQWRHTGAEASVKPTDAILNAYIFSSKITIQTTKAIPDFFCGQYKHLDRDGLYIFIDAIYLSYIYFLPISSHLKQIFQTVERKYI